MKELILIKLGEMVLKGLNRRTFEDTLLKNIRHRLANLGKFEIRIAQSTIFVSPQDPQVDMEEAADRISKIFGIAAFSCACETSKDMDAICETADAYLSDDLQNARTFKVESKRSDKKFPLNSPAISARTGEYLLEQFPHLSVDVHHPDVVVHVEVRDFGAYVHGMPRPGAGGIPVGTGGKAAILISGGLDSPVAAWMLAKRGVNLTAIHFASPPYTSQRAEDKVVRLLELVSQYSGRMKMFTMPFTKIQEEIQKHCPEELFTILMRRFMMRISNAVAVQENCGALITGESLGQVASQTMQAIACTDHAAELPVFRPLIGMDKTEIVAIARKIGTFETSIEPFEDCCTVFTPKHPRTRPVLKYVLEAEQQLPAADLIEECIRDARYIRVGG